MCQKILNKMFNTQNKFYYEDASDISLKHYFIKEICVQDKESNMSKI